MLTTNVHDYVWQCPTCKIRLPRPHTMLFQVLVAPKWSQYIINYLMQCLLPKKVSRVHKKSIELEAFIANQLYKRDKDKKLRFCVIEVEYVKVLEQAHREHK